MSDSLLHSSDKDAQIASLQALLAERDASLAEAKAELLHRDLLIETMRVQLARLRRMQFGASSEKLRQEIEQLELALEELEVEAIPVAQTIFYEMGPARRRDMGIAESLIRVSVGIEDRADLVGDFRQALG